MQGLNVSNSHLNGVAQKQALLDLSLWRAVSISPTNSSGQAYIGHAQTSVIQVEVGSHTVTQQPAFTRTQWYHFTCQAEGATDSWCRLHHQPFLAAQFLWWQFPRRTQRLFCQAADLDSLCRGLGRSTKSRPHRQWTGTDRPLKTPSGLRMNTYTHSHLNTTKFGACMNIHTNFPLNIVWSLREYTHSHCWWSTYWYTSTVAG